MRTLSCVEAVLMPSEATLISLVSGLIKDDRRFEVTMEAAADFSICEDWQPNLPHNVIYRIRHVTFVSHLFERLREVKMALYLIASPLPLYFTP